jgi:hypothetical protein
MSLITCGNQYDEWQYNESMIFEMHVNCYTCQWLIHEVIHFTNLFRQWYNKHWISSNMVLIPNTLGTTWWGVNWVGVQPKQFRT